MGTTRHIRTKPHRIDKRMRMAMKRKINANSPTLCGAEGQYEDTDIDSAKHVLQYKDIPKLAHWSEDLCPDCVDVMKRDDL